MAGASHGPLLDRNTWEIETPEGMATIARHGMVVFAGGTTQQDIDDSLAMIGSEYQAYLAAYNAEH